METKWCSKCQKYKPLDQFHRNRARPNGFAYRCKPCFEISHKKYRISAKGKATRTAQKVRPEYKEQMRCSWTKYNQSEKRKAASDRYRSSEKAIQIHRKVAENYRRNHPDRVRAHWAIKHEKRMGRLPKLSSLKCECGQPAEHWHHYKGYEKKHWLDVIPICRSCHDKIH